MTKTIAKPDDDLGRLGLIELAGEWSRRMRSPRVRSLCQFSEEEIIVPTGPYRDRPFKLARHPAPRLLFPEIDSGRWRRVIVTGPNQDGKSLIGFVIWALWVLFELRETLILGAPSIDLVSDKWRDDLLPVIKASRYRTLLPTSGKGSRDGDAVRFDFKNGVDLRFMTGGGRDYARAGKASQYLAITEMEGFDVVGGASREGTKFDQLQRRTLAFGDDARIVGESTVGTEAGRTWQEYQAGTQSRIALPCPHCGAFVTPEREHLKGWQEAATDAEARRSCFIACPECGAAWTNDERLDANDRAVLVHKGQSVEPDGTITGDVPDTDTLSFRWTCVNSTLRPERMSMVGGLEWAALRSDKSDEAERDIRQSQWALPAKPKVKDLSGLDVAKIAQRVIPGLGRGICPAETRFVTVACDIGKYVCHWTAIAWRDGATPHICDYGVLEVNPQEMGEERGILIALRQFRDGRLAEGFMLSDRTRQEHTEEGEAGPAKDEPRIYPTMRAFDAGNWQDTVLAFAAESGDGHFGTKGYGIGQRNRGRVARPTGSRVLGTFDGYAEVELPDGRRYVEVDADRWKTWLHARLNTPIGQPGALTLYDGKDHFSFTKHLMAERQIEAFDPKQGTITRWEAVNDNNHWLDATVLACVMGHAAGARIIADTPVEYPEPAKPARTEEIELPRMGRRW